MIAGFYHCYARPKAVEAVLRSFREQYPEATLAMACDAGLDLSGLAAYYGASYTHCDRQVGNGKCGFCDSHEKFEQWGQRLVAAARAATEPHILLLEDDVLVLKTVSSELRYSLNGTAENRFPRRLSKTIAQLTGRKPPSHYSGFGGCIVEREFLLSIADKLSMPEPLRGFFQLPTGWDMWLSIVVAAHGGTIGQYSGLCETWWADFTERTERGDIEVLHQFKAHYS